MLEGIYIVVALLLFLAQLKNGFFTALLTGIFWPIVIVGSTAVILLGLIYSSLKRKNPHKELEKELISRKIYRAYLIYNSDSFRNKYLPEHLKFIEKNVDGKNVLELPNLDKESDYFLFVDAVSRFMEDHHIVHQTMKGWFIVPTNERKSG